MFPGSIFPRNEKHHFGIIFFVLLFLLGLDETQGCAVVECICHRGEIDCLNLGYRSVPFFNADGRIYDTLDLSKNRLRRVRGHAFKNLTVRKIKIRNNMRKLELNKKAFKGLEGMLEVLIITRSQMETLPPFLFKKTEKLRVLILSDNHFVSLPPNVFQGASSVLTLDLMGNSLVKLVPGMFAGLDNLKFLRLGNNKISVIDTEAFRGLDNLNGLILSRNEIRDLQPRSFKRLVNLIRLDLGNNKIPALFPLMFRGMERLEELSLNANPLLIIGEAAFSSMSSLKTLYLSQGHLRYLKANMFKGLDKLDKLQLDNNYITYLQDNVFMYLPNLKRLQIINNVLSTINPCAFPDITKMKEIRATQNPLVCTCPLQWAALDSMPVVAGRCAAPSRNRGNQAAARMTYHGCTVIDVPTICKNGAGGRLATAVDPDHVVTNKTKMDKYLKAIMQVNETKRKKGSFTDRLKGVKRRRSKLG